jgi:NADH-quinone oxidoreductase subunit E
MKRILPELEAMKARIPPGRTSSLVLPSLHRIQAERGFVADEDIALLAAHLGVPRVQIEEVLSFYTMFRRAPRGRHLVEVCRNVSCSMLGAERILAHLKARLGIGPGETTPDGRITLGTAECLASCGTGPVMVVDGAYHERLTEDRVDAILEVLP